MKAMISRLIALKTELIKKEDRLIINKSLNRTNSIKPSDMIMNSLTINNEYLEKQRSYPVKSEGII